MHGVGGALGTVLIYLRRRSGWRRYGHGEQVMIQLVAVGFVVWVVIFTCVEAALVTPLRVEQDSKGWTLPSTKKSVITCTQLIKVVLHIDDSLDVFPVHGVGGALGTVLTGIFAAEGLGGAGMDTSIGEQVMIQLVAVGFVVAWVVIFTFIALKLVSLVTPLRVEQDDEIEGLDITQHEEISYHL